jgi:hypothetical protein
MNKLFIVGPNSGVQKAIRRYLLDYWKRVDNGIEGPMSIISDEPVVRNSTK